MTDGQVDCNICGTIIVEDVGTEDAHIWWLSCAENDSPGHPAFDAHSEHCFSFCDECVISLARLVGGELELAVHAGYV